MPFRCPLEAGAGWVAGVMSVLGVDGVGVVVGLVWPLLLRLWLCWVIVWKGKNRAPSRLAYASEVRRITIKG